MDAVFVDLFAIGGSVRKTINKKNMEGKKSLIILTVGKDGCYVQMAQNTEDGSLQPTKGLVCAGDVVPYGFLQHFEKKFPYRGKRYFEQAQKNMIQTLIDELTALSETVGAPYVLIDQTLSGDWTYLQLTCKYYFLVAIRKHIDTLSG